MRLTLVISALTGGGAERVLVLLTEGFLKKGYDVAVVTLSGIERDFYKLPDEVHRLALNILGNSSTPIDALWNNLYRLLILRRAIRSTQPDVVISFVDRANVLTLLALSKTSYLVFPTEHCDPVMNPCGKLWNSLRRMTYPHATKVVSVSQGIDSYFEWLPKTKRAVIYNPLILIEKEQSTIIPKGADPDKPWIVAMGRLSYQKGFDILLSAFHQIADKYPNWQLLILGEGEVRSKLETLIENLGLSERVFLPGIISNPFPVLRKSKLFVMASRFEGFPMAHGEAMACGLPVISTDCPSGPREIIRDGVDGILVPNGDVSALAAAMERLIYDEKERLRLAARTPEVVERFSLEKVMGMWEAVFMEGFQITKY